MVIHLPPCSSYSNQCSGIVCVCLLFLRLTLGEAVAPGLGRLWRGWYQQNQIGSYVIGQLTSTSGNTGIDGDRLAVIGYDQHWHLIDLRAICV